MDDETFRWTWKHWVAVVVSAGLWIVLWYGVGALVYWIIGR